MIKYLFGENMESKIITTASGLKYEDLIVGTGEYPKTKKVTERKIICFFIFTTLNDFETLGKYQKFIRP